MKKLSRYHKLSQSLALIPTGIHTRQDTEYVFVPDAESKECFGCDGTGISVRLHGVLNA